MLVCYGIFWSGQFLPSLTHLSGLYVPANKKLISLLPTYLVKDNWETSTKMKTCSFLTFQQEISNSVSQFIKVAMHKKRHSTETALIYVNISISDELTVSLLVLNT